MTRRIRVPGIRIIATGAVGVGLIAGTVLSCDRSPAELTGPRVEAAPSFVSTSHVDEPLTLRSENGLLEVTLIAAPSMVDIGGQQVLTTVFNDQYVAPTLRLRRGDLLRITLVNATDMMTNLHTHGLEVSPRGNSDNIFRIAYEGGTLTYEYRIPIDHPAGQFWYHPHVHHNASAQTKFGLSGVIIVEGMEDEIPALRGLRERILVLKDAQIVAGAIDTGLEIGINTTRTVNGRVNPTIEIAPGETQLWRIGNHSANLYYRLTLDGHRLYQVGRDGNRLNQMQALDEVFLVPGGRAEVLVQAAPAEAGQSFTLRTLGINAGEDVYGEYVLATMSVTGEPRSPMNLASVTMAPLPDLRAVKYTSRAITFQQRRDGSGFMVNGQLFDPDRVNTRVRLGTVERWKIQNTTREWHVFHIHQVQFQVVEENGRPVPFDGYRDVVNVPEKGSVTVIIPFTRAEAAGKYVYHCHILDHEDRGMMAVIEVGDFRPNMVAGGGGVSAHGLHH